MTVTNPPTAATPTPVELIAWEAAHLGHSSRKEAAIRNELRLTPARYYVLLYRAAHDAAALAADPFTCGTVRRAADTPPRGDQP